MALLEQKYFAGRVHFIIQKTVLGDVVAQRLSQLPQFLRNLVEQLALEGMHATSLGTFIYVVNVDTVVKYEVIGAPVQIYDENGDPLQYILYRGIRFLEQAMKTAEKVPRCSL